MRDFVETRIIEAVRGLLAGRVNEMLQGLEYSVPGIEFGGYGVSPEIELISCESTEKERIVRQDAYSLIITISLPDIEESELYCYVYSGAISRAICDDPTLGGVVTRAVITGKKYLEPKVKHCGEGWGVVISLRVTIETTGGE